MEQILECLLAEMKAMQQKIETNHERMKAKKDAFQEKVDDGQEEVKAQVGSLTFWIDANQEEIKAMLDACLEEMEANPGEQKSIAVHEEVPKEEATAETVGSTEEAAWGSEPSCRAPPKAEEKDLGHWWLLEEVGHRLQKDDPPCGSGMV
jgi:hypothetical protein